MEKFKPRESIRTERLVLLKREHEHDQEMWQAIEESRPEIREYLFWVDGQKSQEDVVKSTDLPFDYYFKKIDKFLADKTYIGIDGDIPKELIDKYHPVIITSQELNHKFIHTNNDEIVFVCGNDITNSKKSFYLNCLIKIYQDNETFDINKYNIIIPNNIKRG